jgi:putative DNA primase/helicase
MRRRIHLVPFDLTIPREERDLQFPNKLKAEWGGILQWAVDGCLEWQRIGLAPPQIVKDATEEYLNDEDSLQRWVDECCIVEKTHWEVGERLWSSWKTWAERNNEKVGTRKSFGQSMKNKGFKPEKSQQVRGHVGISLRSKSDSGDRWDGSPI